MATLVVGFTTEIYNKNSEPDCYQRGHGVKYSDFKLATSTSVLSILEFFYSHIPQALRFYHYLCFFGNFSLFASYAMLMRPRNLKTAAIKI